MSGATGHPTPGAVERVQVHADPESLARAIAQDVAEAARRAIDRAGRFLWCLAGGHTPRRAYALLATDAFASRIDWTRVHVFFGDERCVPPSHERSNHRMACAALLTHVPLDASRIHRIAGEDDPERAADAYAGVLEEHLGVASGSRPAHGFDLLHLGMGEDGHTASLFPGSPEGTGRWVEARRHPGDGAWRVTLTPPVLDASAAVRFLVSGPDKAPRLLDVLTGPPRPAELPVQRIRPSGEAVWMVDREAAAGLLEDTERASGRRTVEVEVHR